MMTFAAQDLETRRRRALYRAAHRGTKEMDWLMSRYAEAMLPAMLEAELSQFETLLALPDPELQRWILSPSPGQANELGDLGDLVSALRRFHGLGT
jgi:antitoxin CptB